MNTGNGDMSFFLGLRLPAAKLTFARGGVLFWYVLLSLVLPRSGKATDTQQIRIDPSICYQTIDGFGASDAWRCQFVGKNWPLEKREHIADLLFSQESDAQGNPKGIGLSIWRFYLSAGTAEQGDDSDIGNPWRRGECFLDADGTYDWTKLAGQQWFLKAARDRGVERFLAFPNAAPVHLSKNGKGYAPKGNIHLNVKPGCLDDYAAYLVEVMDHFSRKGMGFDYLSPINEPQWNWDGSGQEGTPALNEEIYGLVRYLSHGLSAKGLRTRIVIGEAGTIGHAAMTMDFMGMTSDGRDDQARFFFNEESPFYIGDLPNVETTISAHSYQSVWPLDKQVAYRHMLHKALKAANPALGYWQSEYCILQRNGEIRGGGGRDLGMNTALYVARIIHHDLTIAQAKSWQWWTALSQVDFKDGLVYLDDGSQGETGKMGAHIASLVHDGEVRQSKLLWTLGNYSRFIRPGMVRIQCDVAPKQSYVDGVLASAYKDKSNRVVLVLVNLSTEEKRCDLGLTDVVEVYTTSAEANMRKSRQESAGIRIPARAVATVRIDLCGKRNPQPCVGAGTCSCQ
jgi:O-glycosyl hydrolase